MRKRWRHLTSNKPYKTLRSSKQTIFQKQVNLNPSPGQQDDDYETVDDAQKSKWKSMLAFPANKVNSTKTIRFQIHKCNASNRVRRAA